MKRRIVWSVILVVLLVIGLIFTVGCGEPEVQTPKQYVPKYSANQVIDVVRAQYPTCFKREETGWDAGGMMRYTTVDTPTQISVQFVGGTAHAWRATITCPPGYYIYIGTSTARVWIVYFWETDGSLYYSLQ